MSFKLIEKQILYDGTKVRLEIHHYENEDTGKRIKREVCAHPGAVVVLPFLDENNILLIRTKRYAVGQLMIELPAGTLEKGEPPINCAGRELLEETGYLAKRIKPIASFFTSPGILSEKMHAFAAYDLQQSQQALEEGEEIEVHNVPFDVAIQMIKTGEISDAKSIVTLMMYHKFMRSSAL